MKHILYTVEICMDEGIGNILAAQCQCIEQVNYINGHGPVQLAAMLQRAIFFTIEDHATHATEVSGTSQLQQWNKPALKPNSPTLIRDACFTVHKDDKADAVCKPIIVHIVILID